MVRWLNTTQAERNLAVRGIDADLGEWLAANHVEGRDWRRLPGGLVVAPHVFEIETSAPDDWITPAQYAAACGLTKSQIDGMLRNERIPKADRIRVAGVTGAGKMGYAWRLRPPAGYVAASVPVPPVSAGSVPRTEDQRALEVVGARAVGGALCVAVERVRGWYHGGEIPPEYRPRVLAMADAERRLIARRKRIGRLVENGFPVVEPPVSADAYRWPTCMGGQMLWR